MATVVIDSAEGPLVHIQVNGTHYALETGDTITVSSSQLAALTNSSVLFERVYRTQNVPMTSLAISNETFTDAAAENDPIGTLDGYQAGSTITITDDPSGGMVALNGDDLVVGATALVANTYNVEFTETNDEIAEGSKATTIAIVVEAA